MVSRILNTEIALPAHEIGRPAMADALGAWLHKKPLLRRKALTILANAGVERRYAVRPAPWYLEHTGVEERNAVYREAMIQLCGQAAAGALAGAGVSPRQVGLIVTTSCTGVMIPSVESTLINRMDFSPTVRRLPIMQLGCVAGAAALSQAHDFLLAHPAQAALVISAELASLTAQVSDFSMANIVSSALFGDGVGAVVLGGAAFCPENPPLKPSLESTGAEPQARALPLDTTEPSYPRIVATRSELFPNSEDLMGFEHTGQGLKIFLLSKVPRVIKREIPRVLKQFLAEQGLERSQLKHFLLHPGGRKVLEGLQQRLRLSPAQTRHSWAVLRDYGNLSSATVLYILHAFAREARPQPGELGLLMAVGPGFSAELVLLQW